MTEERAARHTLAALLVVLGGCATIPMSAADAASDAATLVDAGPSPPTDSICSW
jgi:hypothetical protein